MSQSSPSELHLTAVNWLTGLAPAAAGACVLLLLDSKTSPDLRVGIAVLVAMLLLGFVFGTLVQLHTIREIGFRALNDTTGVSAAMKHLNLFQNLMLASLYFAVALVIAGAFYSATRPIKKEDSSVGGWKIQSASGNSGAEMVILSGPNESRLVLLKHGPEDTWTTTLFSKTGPERTKNGVRK